MTTFASWFGQQAGRGDDIGKLAKSWEAAAGQRARVSGTQGVTKWMLEHPLHADIDQDRIEPTMVAAATEYRAVRADLAGVPITGSPVVGLPSHQQPVQPADSPPRVPPADFPSLMAALGRIEQGMGQLTAIAMTDHERLARLEVALGPLMALAAEVQAADQGVPEPIEPGLAAQLAGLDELPPPAPVSLYGQHVVTEPDWAALADAAEPGEGGEEDAAG
jgi:hypothetical protein